MRQPLPELICVPSRTASSRVTQANPYMAEACFVGVQTDPRDVNFSPILFPSHVGVVPLVVQIAGLDPLRDESFLYQKLLDKAGVPTKAFVYVPPHS